MSTVPSTVDIRSDSTHYVGSVTFVQPSGAFGTAKTASGFTLRIPASISMGDRPSAETPGFLIEDMEAIFTPVGEDMEIAVCRCPTSLVSGSVKQNVSFSWEGTLPAMAFYERIRGIQEPQFTIRLKASVRRLITTSSHLLAASFPAESFYGNTTITYSRDSWTATHRQIGFRDCVIAEIPYPSDPPHAWEGVWNALRDARNAFAEGGTTACIDAARSVRHALEKWQEIEKEDMGPGWIPPKREEREDRTVKQRIDNIRWHLMQLAHDSAHTGSEKWSRDEALLLLTTLTALIAVRKP